MDAITPVAEIMTADSASATLPARRRKAQSAPIPADSLLNFVARAMADPGIDVDKLQLLISIQRDIVAADAKLQFNRAMSLAQGEMVPIARDAQNTQTNSKYATLERIDAVIRPIYVRHGFLLSFNSEAIDGPNERIVCEVAHFAGHTKQYQLEAAIDTAGARGNANKTPLHGLGSVISYLRRYLTCMIFNIVLTNEDNDGNRIRPEISNDGRMTSAQLAELGDLMARTASSEGKLLAHHKLDFRSMEQVPATEFVRLKNSLLSKVRVLQQRAEMAAKVQRGEAA